eukprot:TRINITY_DN992_c0_g1_i1.p1 TRINITY_DN992_c0_g1~~TRINITY_DN992_c0_g1_i1.p1  ORF type:complete len:118 (+),score=29.48 TRINITY_DN992_c0_g1_i1:77-430(+)
MKSFVAASLVIALSAVASATSSVHFRGLAAKEPEPRLPIGEGAYQSAKAVAQRTTDSRKDCEEAKWADCYKTKGDYTDVHGKPEAPRVRSAPQRSAATSTTMMTGVLVAFFAALARC